MLLKNVTSQGVYLFAYDTTNKVAKTGDAANITGHISKDGGAGASFGTANPTEIGGGVYWQPLAQAETNANAVGMYWASATSGVQIDPAIVLTTGVNLPVAAPAAAGGLPTCNATVNGTPMPKVDVEGFAGAATATYTGVAQAGSATSITLAAGEANNPLHCEIAIVGGTGAGQKAVCTAWNATTKVATTYCPQGTAGAWVTNPDATSQYAINDLMPNVDGSGQVTLGGYASGQDPASLLLTTPAGKIANDASGNVKVQGPFKANTAAGFSFRMVQSSDNKSPYTNGSVTGTRSIAGSGQGTSVSGTVTQLGATSEYYFSGTAADFNGAEVHFAFTATGANPVYVTINTTP